MKHMMHNCDVTLNIQYSHPILNIQYSPLMLSLDRDEALPFRFDELALGSILRDNLTRQKRLNILCSVCKHVSARLFTTVTGFTVQV